MKRILHSMLTGLSLAAAITPAAAQEWPTRPIQLIVPQAPGGGADILARDLAMKLQPKLGQPVVVENKAGAGGVIGTDYVARAAGDGYTFMMGAISTHGINPGLYKNLSYDARKDFVPVALVATAPLMVVLHPSVPANSVQELIDLAKAKPGELTFSSAGTGNSTHLSGELFKNLSGVDMLHVPFKGATPAEVGLIGGQVSVMFSSIMTALPHSKEGRMKALAVTSEKRSSIAPELPAVAETKGMEGFDVNPWYGIFAPAGTPAEAVKRMHAEISEILKEEDVRKRFASLGAEPGQLSQEEFVTYVHDEMDKWARIIKESGTSVD